MNMLIADAGSTKTDWAVIRNGTTVKEFRTPGINPSTQSRSALWSSLLLASGQLDGTSEEHIYFYGAGCREHPAQVLGQMLEDIFPKAEIKVFSDLLGAARASCQGKPGLAGILGTGSNSCMTDGHEITASLPALGYLLGDEGSGNHYGKALLKSYFYGRLDDELTRRMEEEFPEIKDNYLSVLYSSPRISAELAAFFPFLERNKKHPVLKEIIHEGVMSFIQQRILPLTGRKPCPVHLAGSVAHQLNEEYRVALENLGFREVFFSEAPLRGLIKYHMDHA